MGCRRRSTEVRTANLNGHAQKRARVDEYTDSGDSGERNPSNDIENSNQLLSPEPTKALDMALQTPPQSTTREKTGVALSECLNPVQLEMHAFQFLRVDLEATALHRDASDTSCHILGELGTNLLCWQNHAETPSDKNEGRVQVAAQHQ
ncbi:hypothetical protein PAXRUDRAFT_833176 [Paxillus rubicundulus Ve08.2h10]|uniref:Uncharacterized protein n=1 Tax=Paxillus rubicundulus Ve08.2h10 TaxID=930991 RepID=A0A0D0DHQ0_9AGAM|nr:hypothetical protein PAXRUDRAFT_833176 [Paxillus rubicundulus Ve08.2h10]